MSAGTSATLGFAAGALVCFAATPVAIRVARRTGFYDRPREYRQNKAPTPFLGGVAVLLGTFTAAAVTGAFSGRTSVLLACAFIMWLVGTIDDRIAVAPKWRVLVTGLAAISLSMAGLGWKTDGGTSVDAILTLVWVVGLVNAFNFMDNMDGACVTVAACSALGIGALALIYGQPVLAGLSFGLAGACIGFLPWNLAGPAKIFLGDGGSMFVGFSVAALAMAASNQISGGEVRLLAGGLVVALPILDITLVVISRTRRGVTVTTGGRDHLTHRLLLALGAPRVVAVTLAVIQSAVCLLAVISVHVGPELLIPTSLILAISGLTAIAFLDTARWRPANIAVGSQAGIAGSAEIQGVDSS